MIKLNLKPERRILGQFAWFAAIAFPVFAALLTRGEARAYQFWAWNWSHPAVLWLGGLGVVQLAAFVAGVRQLTQALYVVLMVVAWPIGFVISHVFLAVVYYLVMTPIGLLFRLLGRDTLGRSIDRGAKSYWHDRGAPRSADSYFKLY